MTTEKIEFKITISGTYWDRKPDYIIKIDDKEYTRGEISAPSDEPQVVSFFAELENGPHTLSIGMSNKTDDQTVKDPPEGDLFVIAKDMLLNVVNIEVDGIELGALLWDGVYRFDRVVDYQGQTGISELKGCVNMGWNGSYNIDFESPFYLWLLEKL